MSNIKSKLHLFFWVILVIGLVISTIPENVLANNEGIQLDDATSLYYYLNGIYWYNPQNRSGICPSNTSSITGDNTGSNNSNNGTLESYRKKYPTLVAAVETYGLYAMQLQVVYGSPWEVIFAQMQKESQTGTCQGCVASHVAEMGGYNWLGITQSGDLGYYTSASGRKWAAFKSVESMMNAWAGPRVLRNGYYDKAFKYTDPENYNLEDFIKTMLSTYAPSSDGNNESQYYQDVMSFINGPIAAVREANNWPTSAELATNTASNSTVVEQVFQAAGKNTVSQIGIGGDYEIGSSVGSDTLEDSNWTISCGISSGDLEAYVLAYAWPEYHKPNYFDMMPDYQEIITVRSQNHKYVGGGGHPGIDCGGFVTTLLQESGFDPDYGGEGAVGTQLQYVKDNNWEVVEDIDDLQPGDVAFNGQSHTFIFVGDIEGFESNIASASYGGNSGSYWRAPMAGKESLTKNVTWYHKP